jgi:hypothetical protein
LCIDAQFGAKLLKSEPAAVFKAPNHVRVAEFAVCRFPWQRSAWKSGTTPEVSVSHDGPKAP